MAKHLQEQISSRLLIIGCKEAVSTRELANWILKHFTPMEGHFEESSVEPEPLPIPPVYVAWNRFEEAVVGVFSSKEKYELWAETLEPKEREWISARSYRINDPLNPGYGRPIDLVKLLGNNFEPSQK